MLIVRWLANRNLVLRALENSKAKHQEAELRVNLSKADQGTEMFTRSFVEEVVAGSPQF